MMEQETKSGSELFIVDNSDADWKVRNYLHDWCGLAKQLDVATGYFEIGGLLALRDAWKDVDAIRILMGDEVSLRTSQAFAKALDRIKNQLDESIELEKESNDFLTGVPAIVQAIRDGKIVCKVYRKDKFHAKCYITQARKEVLGAFALVGSSNLTYPGLTDNVELNVQLTGRQVGALQDWYERYWNEAEDVSPQLLRTIEPHIHDYQPFDVYVKALQEFFRGHELTASEWECAPPEKGGSRMMSILDQYQKEAYWSLIKIARQFKGAFLCDGVGLGKTFVGLMLIERLAVHERKRVALFAPKGALESVWKPALREFLPHVGGPGGGDFSNLVVFSHTDLGREGTFPERFERIKEMAHAVIIDEAHHFRNPGPRGVLPDEEVEPTRADGRIRGGGRRKPSRYRLMFDLLEGTNGPKDIFMLTASPINNKLLDFRHMVDLFARKHDNYFNNRLGIHSLRGHFIKMEKQLKQIMEARDGGDTDVETNLAEAGHILVDDSLFRAVVVQRSRAYARESQVQHGATAASFPTRKEPQVVGYSIKKTYGRLLNVVEKAFNKDKPLFALALYYPLAYYKGSDDTIDPFVENRQKQIVGLIRTQFLKRFESSSWAFERSCEQLMIKLLTFVTRHSETAPEKRRLDRWQRQHAELIDHVQRRQLEYWRNMPEEDADEDLITEEMLESVDYLDRDEYKVEEMLQETYLDLGEIVKFLEKLHDLKPGHDDKLRELVSLLKRDPVLKKHKVLIFTEFADTARYLRDRLRARDIDGVDEVDGQTKDRLKAIRRFAPYYNGSSSAEIERHGTETRVLISTDVLAEGLNLQDCTRVINYDIHWNPVRLMQRIGRVDRRLNPKVEQRILADHPDQADIRGKTAYWNFLPPDDLDALLKLYGRVAHKTLRISKTFGIEGRKLLRPDDDYDALREFNDAYEGSTTPIEEMHLEYQQLLRDNPELEDRIKSLPGRVFSGKAHPTPGTQAVFFCYCLPKPDYGAVEPGGEPPWTEEAGDTKWYLYTLADASIVEEPAEIVALIRSTPETPRRCEIEQATLSEIRRNIEKHIKNTYLKKLQAPVGVKPKLKCWMELS